MELIIDVSKNNPELILRQDKKVIARHPWQGHLNLSEKLLLEIDKFLKKQNLKLEDLKKITTRKNKRSMMTSNIAQVTADVLSWAAKLE